MSGIVPGIEGGLLVVGLVIAGLWLSIRFGGDFDVEKEIEKWRNGK